MMQKSAKPPNPLTNFLNDVPSMRSDIPCFIISFPEASIWSAMFAILFLQLLVPKVEATSGLSVGFSEILTPHSGQNLEVSRKVVPHWSQNLGLLLCVILPIHPLSKSNRKHVYYY